MKRPRLTTGRFVRGPMPSRRLGSKLVVDSLASNRCPLDCVYCPVSREITKSTQREYSVSTELIVGQLKKRLDEGCSAGWITLGGTGDPTLYQALGELIVAIKRLTRIPVALVTSGALFSDPIVRAEALLCDLVIVKLDAGDKETFLKLNRPVPNLRFDSVLEGLRLFRRIFYGKLWVEVMVVEGFNDTREELKYISRSVRSILPDRVQLNSPVQTTPGSRSLSVTPGLLVDIAKRDFDGIVDTVPLSSSLTIQTKMKRRIHDQEILNLALRHPCTLHDLCMFLDLDQCSVACALDRLVDLGCLSRQTRDSSIFYASNSGREDVLGEEAC